MPLLKLFASKTVREGELHSKPFIPEKWISHALIFDLEKR
jgi:hypothetical protein